MTTIYYVRHAEPDTTEHNDEIRPLTVKGMEDAKKVTEFLIEKNIDVFLSSPFKRAVDTIKDCAEKLEKEIIINYAFRERKIADAWIEDFNSFSMKQWNDFDYKLSNGECLREVQERNIKALEEVVNRYEGKTLVIGGHGAALSTILNYYNSTFGYKDFEEIKPMVPCIVEFIFDKEKCVQINRNIYLGKK